MRRSPTSQPHFFWDAISRCFWKSEHCHLAEFLISVISEDQWQDFWFRSRAMMAIPAPRSGCSCPSGVGFRRSARSARPHPAFFLPFVANKATSSIRPLRDAWVALGPRLGHPRATQGPPRRHPIPIPIGRGSQVWPLVGLANVSCQLLAAASCYFSNILTVHTLRRCRNIADLE